MKLYFIYMEGCPACDAAKPHLAKWEKKARGVEVVRLDLLTAKWVNPWQPQATPTYVLEIPGQQRVMHEGALEEHQIHAFIQKAAALMGAQ